MLRNEIEKLAIEYDRNLKTHPASASELRKDLVEFALYVIKNSSTPDFIKQETIINEKLIIDAKDFMNAIETWADKEFKNGFAGHKVVEMRPILIAKNICRTILKNR